MTEPLLHCAACGAEMTPDEAEPVGEPPHPTLHIHRSGRACARVVLAEWTRLPPALRERLAVLMEVDRA